MKLFLLALAFLLLIVANVKAQTHLPHMPYTFRYAKDVNPIDFLKLDPRIIEILGGVARFCKHHNVTLMITSAIRTPERNREVKSVSLSHVEGRALDFSIKKEWGWTPQLIKKLEQFIERRYGRYGLYSPILSQKVIVIHNANNGTGTHGHLQVTKQSYDDYFNLEY